MKEIKRKINNQSGAAMLISVIFFLFISLAIISGLVGPTVREFKIANDLIKSRQSLFLSESGIEDAYYRLKTAMNINNDDATPEIISLNGNTATTSIVDSGYNKKTISSLGDVSSRHRKNKLMLDAGSGISYSYGVQAGNGGFELGNATVNGNVYSNGIIAGANGATITGSAISAGALGLIDNIDIGISGVGDARAHTVKNSTIAGNLYCKIDGGGNDKNCDMSGPDPGPADMPITQDMIDKWKADANINGDEIAGDLTISSPTSLGPKKIVGNLAINNDLTVTGTIYVTGNITTNNNAQVRLFNSYGPTGGIIIVDGKVVLDNGVEFFGSGSLGSYVLLATTSSCPSGCSGSNAMEIMNNVGAILINAQNGTVHLNNNVNLNEVVGNKIIIDNSATVNYLSGLASTLFTSGPSGGWSITSWKEIE